VINVQGDEPLVSAGQIRALAELVQGECPMGTLGMRFKRAEDFMNPNQVKVVTDSSNRALYFSRSPIPYPRDEGPSLGDDWLAQNRVYRHLGLYSYRGDFLKTFSEMPPGRLEQIEKLEQLRVLEAGYEIAVGYTEEASIGIDTPSDVAEFEAHLSG
jgi:3-deoxy-manno-octulosonate cytidylyltransferase (CMP-KDO synthetase)